MDLSHQEMEIVRGGLAAADLLAHESFISTIRSLMYERFCKFTETQPHEGSVRENIYNQYLGLQAIEGELRARVQQKDAIELRLNAIQSEPDE